MKRLYSVLLVCAAVAGMFLSITQTEAADIGKIRGRVNVDLETFVCVEKTNNDSGMKPLNDKKSEYELWFSNSFTDRNNIGVTYRSGSTYEMTDVDKIETYMCSRQTSNDKFLLYVNTNPYKYYHRMDIDDINSSAIGGNGTYWYFRNLVVKITNNVYSKDYYARSTTISPRYGGHYVFYGLAHEWQWHNAQLTFDNETQSGEFQGGLTLILKKHRITLLQPDYPKQVLEDGSQKEYVAFTNLKMRLEDGKSYDPGQSGDIYRDERVTVQYTLADAGNCSLKGYRFYSDKDRKNLLYTKKLEGGETESSFTLDAGLIQSLEYGKSVKSLGDIYVEPVFEQRKVTVDISQTVPEDTNVKVTPVTSGKDSDSFELQVVENGKTEVIGSFRKNKAANIGDVITFDYTPNSKYKGSYLFSHYEYRMCESQNQVAGTFPVEALYSADQYDISQKLGQTYFWMQLHVMLKAEVILKDKTVTYNNRNVAIDPAEVKYPEGHPAPTGTITYQYYRALGDVTHWGLQEEIDGPPIDAGIYYVVATMRQDAHYVSAESRPAILTIEKAVPTLSNVRGTKITYGDSLSESKLTGTAEGVSKSKLGGTFTWKDGNQKLNAGANKADVKFTPDERYAANYTDAEGKAMVSVDPAVPVIHKGNDKTVTYDGEPVVMEGAYAAGIDGKDTGQKITYEYYSREACDRDSKLPGPPKDRGVYYVLASAAAQGNYNYAKAAEASVITINQRAAGLLQVPFSALTGAAGAGEYRVYATNGVAEGPQGTVQLSWEDVTETKKIDIGRFMKEEGTGRYYASAVYGQNGMLPAGGQVEITASYTPITDGNGNDIDNYTIAEDTLSVNTDSAAIEKSVENLVYGGGRCKENVETTLRETLGDSLPADAVITDVKWQIPKVNDVTEFNTAGEDITITPKNAGTASATAYVAVGEVGGSETHYYVTYHCQVAKAAQPVSIEEASLIYNAFPQTYRVKRGAVGDVTAGDITDISEIHYAGTSYLGEDYDGVIPPADAGEYTMKVRVPATRNLEEYAGECKMVIGQAKPKITIEDRTVTYDGQPQTLEPAVVDGGIPNGTEVTGAVSYQYTYAGSVPVDKKAEVQAGAADAGRINSPDAPVHSGIYNVTAAVAADGNYGAASSEEGQTSPVTLTIEQAVCTVEIRGKQAVYTGEPVLLDSPVITGVGDESVTADTTIVYRPSATLKKTEFIRNPTEAGIYYGWAVKGNEGDYKAAMSDRAVLVIRKADVEVEIPDRTMTYSGRKPTVRGTVQGLVIRTKAGEDITAKTASSVRYHYFSDPGATEEIEPPVNAGDYYVQAWFEEQDNYKGAKSGVQKLTIEKVVPTLSDVKVSDITYGEMGNAAKAEGKAAGVKSEELKGAFQPEGEICTERMDAGTYEISVRFTPDAEAAVNYQPAEAAATLTVLPAEPEIMGSDKTKVYDGQPAALDEVWLKGVEDMPAPAGEVRYEYFMDAACTQPAPGSGGSSIVDTGGVGNADGAGGLAGTGVTDAGKYYCRVTALPNTGNYREVSEIYNVTVEKAPAAISLRVTAIDKNQADNIVTIHGKLQGVFDNPTGTVKILMRKSAKDGQKTEEYRTAAEDILVTEMNGAYGFTAKVHVGPDGVYDFKAEYAEGDKKNYKVYPGELTEIDMNKLPQHIDFDTHLMQMPYGSDAFGIQVNEAEAPGSGAVTYRLMEHMGTQGAVTVTSEGTVEILDVGTAFVMAVKRGDDSYNGAVSVLCIRVTKAPVTLSMEDKTVVYDGKPQSIQASPVSLDRPVGEKLPVVYVYVDQADGRVLKEAPTGVGTYTVLAYLPETEHYLRAAGRSVLTITQAEASIHLSVYKKDVSKKEVTLVGSLPDVFDWPAGTVTIYMRVHGTEEWSIAAEGIQITADNGIWGFSEVITVPEEQIYDFKAVFAGTAGQNYRILDGIVENVDMRDQKEPGGPPEDNPGTTDPPGGSGADDPDQPSGGGSDADGTMVPDKPYFKDLSADSAKGAKENGQRKAADTGDPVSCLPLVLIAAAGVVPVVMRRKKARDILRS